MIFNTTTKSLLSSLLIHFLVIMGYFIYTYDKSLKISSKEKIISMDLQTIELPKQNIEKPKPKPIKKIVSKVKSIKKVEPKYKPIIKEKIKSKSKPIKEELKPVIKPKPIQQKKILNPIKTKQIVDTQKKQQAFKKMNFEIIRDMVLSNLNYPTIAKKMGWQGVVKVKMIIDSNGKLIHYKIINSSDRKQLDNAALEAIASIADIILPKPKTKITLILPINFRLQ